MINDHEFKPRPYYPDLCDKLLDVDGRRYNCGQKKQEHSRLPPVEVNTAEVQMSTERRQRPNFHTLKSHADCDETCEIVAETARANGEADIAMTSVKDCERLKRSNPDDLRKQGWRVAIHNDYYRHDLDQVWTFWLFTKFSVNAKGEGATDEDALDEVRARVKELES